MGLSRESLKDAGVSAGAKIYMQLRQQRSNHRARAVLGAVESQQGHTDRQLIGHCNQYAREVLGSTVYAPWLHVYAAVSGGFREGWIPDNYYGLVVDPMKGGEAARIALVKSFTNRILHTDALPDLAYIIDGVPYTRDFRPTPLARLPTLLFERDDRVVFKADNSYQGRSVTILNAGDFPPGDTHRFPDGVFQAPIRQHAFFAALCPDSTATVRITTVRETDGTVTVRAAYIRVGRTGEDIVQSTSHVRVAADRHTGVLTEAGYLPDWRRIDRHPDTGARFAGLSIPCFNEAAELCRSLHESCPHMHCLGWDLCIDQDDKVQIMEWNARYNDIKFSEATSGPCFRGLGWEDLWKQGPVRHGP